MLLDLYKKIVKNILLLIQSFFAINIGGIIKKVTLVEAAVKDAGKKQQDMTEESKGVEMYSFIIFDVDGTLIDTENAVRESYQQVIFEEFGRNFTEKELSVAYGIPTPKALERLGFKDVEKACTRYFEFLFEGFARSKPFEGIVEMLEEVKSRNIQGGIVTSRNRCEVANDPSLQRLMDYFCCVISTDDTQKHKPDPDPVLKLIERTGADISNSIYLGDTYYDYMCAKNAGVKFALAAWGARNTENIKADYVLREPKELLALL